jgi:hypothetical protein
MPAATWIGPTDNRTPAGESTVYGLVLHIQQGTEAGTEAWQRNPASQVSSHFLAPLGGGLRQMVDTADKAWCEVAGNAHWVSVEIEGRSGDHLTPAQAIACAQLLAWLHQTHGVPLRVADDPAAGSVTAGGLIYHAAGGIAWGNHPDCPGQPIIDARPELVAQAVAIAAGGTMTDLDYSGNWPRPRAVADRPARIELDDVWCGEQGLPGPYGPSKSARSLQLDRIEAALTALGQQLAKLPGPASARDIAAELIELLSSAPPAP